MVHGLEIGLAHDGEFDQLLGVGIDVGAEVEHGARRPCASASRATSAGRRTPSIVRRISSDMPISTPVLPAETAAIASPFFTDSMAFHIDEPLPRRTAWPGFASIADRTASVWRIVVRGAAVGA